MISYRIALIPFPFSSELNLSALVFLTCFVLMWLILRLITKLLTRNNFYISTIKTVTLTTIKKG